MGLKPLRPTLREKKRYLVYEVISNSSLTPQSIHKAITAECLSFLGVHGSAKAGVQIVSNLSQNNKGIIRVSHRYVDHVKVALNLIARIDGNEVQIRVIGVSGIIKKAQEEFLGIKAVTKIQKKIQEKRLLKK